MDALIWGASGGIGAALVRELKAADWRVFAAARNQTKIPAEADFALPFDVAAPDTLRDTAYAVATESSGVDLVVYAAGDIRADRLSDLSLDDWQSVMTSNLTGAYLALHHSLLLMQPTGHMAWIGAYIDHLHIPKFGAYAAAKAGLESMVAVLRKEQRKQRFTIVRPGAVDTPFWDNAPIKLPANAKTPDTVARAILEFHTAGTTGDLDL